MMKTPIKTPIEGTVTSVRWLPVNKCCSVKIEGNKYELHMQHIDEVIVHPGDPVLQGDIIGYSNQEEVQP